MHLQVGDVVHLKAGDIVPANGILIQSSQSFLVNKSHYTSISGLTCKQSNDDWFLFYNSDVVAGSCSFIVTAIGINSSEGQFWPYINSLQTKSTPQQSKNSNFESKCSFYIVCGCVVLIVFFLIKSFAVPEASKSQNKTEVNQAPLLINLARFFCMLTAYALLAFIAAPQGLSIAFFVTNLFIYKTNKDTNCYYDKIQRYTLETLCNTTSIIFTKTGTLTGDKMAVVRGTFFNGGVIFDTREQLSSQMMDPKVCSKARKIDTQLLNINSTADKILVYQILEYLLVQKSNAHYLK